MIELGRHIEILLLTNDCVIVPGLGGFMAHHIEAHHDADENLFLPPLRTLGFNPQLKLNDSLLAQSYIEAYDISYPEAIRRIESEVNELKQHICNEGKYELNDIGTLYLNGSSSYLFEPCEAGILTPELYGLSSFGISALADKSYTVIVKETQEVVAPREPEIEKEADLADTTEQQDDDDSTIKIKIAWIRNAVAAVAAIIAFLFIATPISNSDRDFVLGSMESNGLLYTMQGGNDTNTMNISPAQIKEAITKKDTATKAATDSLAAATVNKRDSIAKEKKKHEPYCIVLASQITKKNAESYVDELHKNGLEQARVYINNNMVRVVYGNYEKESDAYKELQAVRGNKYFEQAWVYKKK